MPLQLALPQLGFLGYFEVWQLVTGIGAGGNMMLESRAFSASSISGSVIEVSLAKGIRAIYKAHGGLPLSPYHAALVKDEKPFFI